MEFSIVIAVSKNLGFGLNGQLPWKLSQDLQYFRKITTHYPNSSVIMGRKTWDSIPAKYKPLPNRKNIVVSTTLESNQCHVASSLTQALSISEGEVFVIGGISLINEILETNLISQCSHIYLTRIGIDFECDVFLPTRAKTVFQENLFPSEFNLEYVSKSFSQNDVPFDFAIYQRGDTRKQLIQLHPRSEEFQYLQLIQDIINANNFQMDRTQVGTFSVFGAMNKWDLSTNFPLLTTKRVFWRGVVEELLWFVKGDTNSKHLQSKGVHIWDANGSRQFLDLCGLGHRQEGDLGPVYGFQWRHCGAEYQTCNDDYSGQGVDQIQEAIDQIKNNPNSRRIIISAWNPSDLRKMALPPCHILSQFYVANGRLSCLLYQRSCDIGLGVPFNIASYALLTCMIAQVCNLLPGEFVHMMGNTHVYQNHVEPLQEQLKRKPNCLPILKLNQEVKDIDSFTTDDIQLIGYNPKGVVKMEMAV